MKSTTVGVSPELLKLIKRTAVDEDTTAKELVDRVLRAYLEGDSSQAAKAA